MQPEPALAAYRVAETLQQKLHPDDWGLSAHIRLSLAGSLLRLARPAEAETEARAVVDGADYSEARIGLSTRAFARKLLGDALRNLGKPAEALPQLEQSVAEQERARGPDDQLTITALSSLGYLRSLTGDPAGALAIVGGMFALGQNIAFLVALAFAVAASANLLNQTIGLLAVIAYLPALLTKPVSSSASL